MNLPKNLPANWVILRYFARDPLLFVELRDNFGRRLQTVVDQNGSFVIEPDRKWARKVAGARPRFVEPKDILITLVTATASIADQISPQRTLPTFLEGAFKPFGISSLQEIYGRITGCLNINKDVQERMRPIILARKIWRPRPRPRLPLRILGYHARGILAHVQEAWWINEPHIRKFGLEVKHCETSSDLELNMRLKARHILVFPAPDFRVVSNAVRVVHPAGRPRLLIAAGAIEEAEFASNALSEFPPGVSFCLLQSTSHEDPSLCNTLLDSLYGIVHDLPLHEAFSPSTLLVADPASNQNLRLSEFFAAELDKMIQHPPPPSVKDVKRHVKRTGVRGTTKKKLINLADSMGLFADAMHDYRRLLIDFDHEGTGLRPMSEVREKYMENKHLLKLATAVAGDEGVQRHMKEHQDRRVDIGLRRNLRDLSPRGNRALVVEDLYVSTDTCLKASARYDLCMRIGLPLPRSLFLKPPPPVDLVLPKPKDVKGHELELVLFEQDFTVLGDRCRNFQLPTSGPSPIVRFPIRAPARRGDARLRVSLYYRDHMLQSFSLKAKVDLEERSVKNSRFVEMEVDFARAEQIQDLDTLGPRKISVGVNQDPNGTHTFFFKRGNVKRAVSLPQDALKTQIGVFRDLLLKATQERAKFAQPDSGEFQNYFRKLARQGADLWGALYDRHPEIGKALEDIANLEGDTLQFVRHDPNYAFPWAAIYDFELPTEVVGQPEPPVCLGTQNGKPCNHKWMDRKYCVRGFWGVRHRVEQLMFKHRVPPRLEKPTHAKVLFAQGYTDNYTNGLKSDLRKDIGTGLFNTLRDDLLDKIWDRQSGPTIVVVIGHVETKKIIGEPPGPRVVVVPGQQWLRDRDVRTRRRSNNVIGPPQPIILLLGCGTAAVEMNTLNSLFTSFVSAGAAAIVGTECLVFTDLASLFAHDVTITMIRDGESFGDALRLFRRTLLEKGNPLGFVFTAFGDADLRFVS